MQNLKSSLRGLDWVNIFMADVKDGVGIYLSVYLLCIRKWDPSQIGYVLALPGFLGLIVQSPMGAFIDHTKYKRMILIIASLVIAATCLIIIYTNDGVYIYLSQFLLGLVQSVYAPAVAAITLGIVGHGLLTKRLGRNESLNHFGNMVAAIVAGLLGFLISYEAIFYFSVIQCVGIIVAIIFIKEKNINHTLARSAKIDQSGKISISKLKMLFENKQIVFFLIALMLLHLSNGAMLSLLAQKIGVTDVEFSALYLSFCIIIAQAIMVFVSPRAAKWSDNGRKRIFLISLGLIPIRAFLFSFFDDPYILTSLQILDGLAAGIFGVISIIMIADLSKDTGHFNLLQGLSYSAMGLGGSLSSVLVGNVVLYYGFDNGFLFLAVLGIISFFFFLFFVKETNPLFMVNIQQSQMKSN